jgi:dihydrofolate reductase
VGKLVYSAISSLDGYVADEQGRWDWSVPDDEVHAVVNDLQRTLGTHLYGRRLYEVLMAWESMDTPDQPPVIREFARIWQAAEKVVYSKTLETAPTGRTRIERDFDPRAVTDLKAAADHDLLVGGPELASQALEAGLVDELHLFVSPVVVGGGKRALPDGVQANLELTGERRFGNGVVYLNYRTV